MKSSGAWMLRHKLISGLLLIFVLGSCMAALPSAQETPAKTPVNAAPLAESPNAAPSEDPQPEPTQEETWQANLNEDRQTYLVAAAAAFAVRPKLLDRSLDRGAIKTCESIAAEMALRRRASRTGRDFKIAKAQEFDGTLAVMAATVTHVCPELATTHERQVAEREKAQKVRERKRKAAESRRRAAERRQAEEQRQADEAEQYVYYANCTEVENAGAAPIYRGQPGYSSSLDRDGDGVACEQ